MKRKLLSVCTVLFFGIMLIGTFFHEKIDGFFRESVQIATIETYVEEYHKTVEINGTEMEVLAQDSFLLLPIDAVKDNMIYVLETMTVPYGSYDIVRLRGVETAGQEGNMVKIQSGITANDRIVAFFSDTLSDGMRVVVRKR